MSTCGSARWACGRTSGLFDLAAERREMVARGEASKASENPGTHATMNRSPGGATERTAKALPPLRGLAFVWLAFQGLRFASPWLPSDAPPGLRQHRLIPHHGSTYGG